MKKLISVILSIAVIGILGACAINSGVEETNSQQITLYFPDNEALYLHPEIRSVETGDKEIEKVIIEELVNGPKSGGLTAALVGGFEVLSVKNENGICTIDLSEEFSLKNTGGSAQETFAVFSIVNSLCELDGVDNVKINIEGNENAEFGGHFMLDLPFEADMDIVGTKE